MSNPERALTPRQQAVVRALVKSIVRELRAEGWVAFEENKEPVSITEPSSDPDPWLTLQQAAAIVQSHEATLRREMKAGRLRYAKVGGRKSIRLRRSWLDAWLETTSEIVETK